MSDSMRPSASDPTWDDILQAAADLQAHERATTEPAIPIRAALPVQAYRDLLDLTEMDLGSLSRTGLRLAYDVTELDAGGAAAAVSAVVTVLDVGGGTLDVGAQVRYTGRWTLGGFVQWTRQD